MGLEGRHQEQICGVISYRIDNMVDGVAAWSNDMKSLELTISRKMLGFLSFMVAIVLVKKDLMGFWIQRKDLPTF